MMMSLKVNKSKSTRLVQTTRAAKNSQRAWSVRRIRTRKDTHVISISPFPSHLVFQTSADRIRPPYPTRNHSNEQCWTSTPISSSSTSKVSSFTTWKIQTNLHRGQPTSRRNKWWDGGSVLPSSGPHRSSMVWLFC